MHYHLVTTDGAGSAPEVRTLATSGDAEREALRAAMLHVDWAPKRYPGRTWKRGEVAVYLDRASDPERPQIRRELSIVRCAASTPVAHDCVLRSLGVPALNVTPAAPSEPPAEAVILRGQRAG